MQGFSYDQSAARIVFAAGAARTALAGELDRLGVRRVLVVASPHDPQLLAELVEPLGDRVAGTFTEVREHVPVATAEAARAAAAQAGADAVVAIGGGSAVGAAKAIALTTRLPVVAVPTTYAGSEVTPVWGLTENGRKTTGTDPAVLPRVVVYDPELTASLPRELAVASGFNAMAHAVEAMWAPRRNPASTAVAQEAITRLATGLRTGDPAELLCGAWLGASAFAAAGSGLHHKLCHVLGGTFDLPHAATHAIVLPHVLAFNAPGAPDVVARVGRALNPGSDSGSGSGGGVTALRALADQQRVPRALRELGLDEAAIDKAAALTEPVVPDDNPVPVGDGALARLVRAAWSGEDL
jgi:maleylacetate reductase